MNENRDETLTPDPRLREALRWAAGDPPAEEVDWTALRSSLRERAELPLARLRARQRRVRWARPLLPLALAAGLGAVALVGGPLSDRLLPRSSGVRSAAVATPAVSPEEVLTSNLPDPEFRLLVTGRSNPDDLLQVAIDER